MSASSISTPTTSSQPPVPRLELGGNTGNQVPGPCTARTGRCLEVRCTPRTGTINSTHENTADIFCEPVKPVDNKK
tara:strand:- start:513 stop:740 length:228 start_codon:yes stop_codon:yes gene_type:complete